MAGRKSLVDWDEVPFGRLSDAELARRLGVSTPAVLKQRRRRGVLPHAEGRFSTRVRGYPWDLCPLGKLSDGEIAAALGANQTSVTRARRQRGIAAFGCADDYDPDAIEVYRERMRVVAEAWHQG